MWEIEFQEGNDDRNAQYIALDIYENNVIVTADMQDERQCALCKTTCFNSALTVINGREKQVSGSIQLNNTGYFECSYFLLLFS